MTNDAFLRCIVLDDDEPSSLLTPCASTSTTALHDLSTSSSRRHKTQKEGSGPQQPIRQAKCSTQQPPPQSERQPVEPLSTDGRPDIHADRQDREKEAQQPASGASSTAACQAVRGEPLQQPSQPQQERVKNAQGHPKLHQVPDGSSRHPARSGRDVARKADPNANYKRRRCVSTGETKKIRIELAPVDQALRGFIKAKIANTFIHAWAALDVEELRLRRRCLRETLCRHAQENFSREALAATSWEALLRTTNGLRLLEDWAHRRLEALTGKAPQGSQLAPLG
eukprot:TRINITY_DN22734_c0_g1_i1.p1 TRINITY_DN22734_c0_g1~~TRINITY_DN22734_c0_g1_i1.p1  ORF type:complete len:283 (-),score=44.86 TRINITY_DN22734_c0_g1_i1:144-992(-)